MLAISVTMGWVVNVTLKTWQAEKGNKKATSVEKLLREIDAGGQGGTRWVSFRGEEI